MFSLWAAPCVIVLPFLLSSCMIWERELLSRYTSLSQVCEVSKFPSWSWTIHFHLFPFSLPTSISLWSLDSTIAVCPDWLHNNLYVQVSEGGGLTLSLQLFLSWKSWLLTKVTSRDVVFGLLAWLIAGFCVVVVFCLVEFFSERYTQHNVPWNKSLNKL